MLKQLKIPAGHEGGFTVHSLRRSFKTICVNGNVPREVVDACQGHSADPKCIGLVLHAWRPDSQKFMKLAPFADTK